MIRIKTLLICFFFLWKGISWGCSHRALNLRSNIYIEIHTSLLNLKVENIKQKKTLTHKFKKISQLKNTRNAFKKIEYLFSIGSAYEYRIINGPNIDYNPFNGGASQIFKGSGLQKMEELIFSEIFDEYIFINEINMLDNYLENIVFRQNKLQNIPDNTLHQILWESFKYEIYRIEALGITGFDTPISNWGVEETIPALEGIYRMVKVYNCSEYLSKHSANQILSSIRNAQNYVKKNTNFEGFDRLYFIKEYLHPLSELIHQVQVQNSWKTPAKNTGVNHTARNLWDSDFFNNDMYKYISDIKVKKLGEELFYDETIHPIKNLSCATCHKPQFAFADNVTFNNTVDHDLLNRNTPSLWNVAFQTKFFLDGRSLKIQDQIFDVIHNPKEMNSNLEYVLNQLKNSPKYQSLFQAAFGKSPDKAEILIALEAYIRQLVSFNSEFDKYMRGVKSQISDEVKKGFNLFAGKAKCATCHFMPLFNGLLPPFYDDIEFEILGIPDFQDKNKISSDLGRYYKTNSELHLNSFKTTGIRNSHLTAPYMHNGVFTSLEEVIEFYNNGGGVGRGYKVVNQTLPSDSLKLNKQEISYIISFIKSLEDTVQKTP